MARSRHTGQDILRIELAELEPVIWRRVSVPTNATLTTLHAVIQLAMPWTNSHLHAFDVDGVRYADPAFSMEDMEEKDAGRIRLESALPKVGAEIIYTYDFGDDWLHIVTLEERVAGEPRSFRCLAGGRAAPPEDCGGVWGYEELQLALKDPDHERHGALTEWIVSCRRMYADFDKRFRDAYDPEAFDAVAATRALSVLAEG